METFSIVLLPCEKDLKKLDALKLIFNSEGFRHKITNTATHSHITLAQCSYSDESELTMIKKLFFEGLKDFKPITIKNFSITKEKREPNGKVNYTNYWIALAFDDKKLTNLTRAVEEIMRQNNLFSTDEYIKRFHSMGPKSKARSIVGDHLNLCNYCKSEKANEAYDLVKNNVKDSIYFDSVGLRYKNGDLAWKFILGNNSQHPPR